MTGYPAKKLDSWKYRIHKNYPSCSPLLETSHCVIYWKSIQLCEFFEEFLAFFRCLWILILKTWFPFNCFTIPNLYTDLTTNIIPNNKGQNKILFTRLQDKYFESTRLQDKYFDKYFESEQWTKRKYEFCGFGIHAFYKKSFYKKMSLQNPKP